MTLAPSSTDVLLTLAEISIAFAGFASVVAIFQKETEDDRAFDLFRFWTMLEFSLATLAFALLPFPLHFLGLSESTIWGIGSASVILFIAGHQFVVGRWIRSDDPGVAASVTPTLSFMAAVVYLVIVVLQILNLLGLGFERSFGPYLAGLSLLLFGAGVNFVRLVWVGYASLNR